MNKIKPKKIVHPLQKKKKKKKGEVGGGKKLSIHSKER